MNFFNFLGNAIYNIQKGKKPKIEPRREEERRTERGGRGEGERGGREEGERRRRGGGDKGETKERRGRDERETRGRAFEALFFFFFLLLLYFFVSGQFSPNILTETSTTT